MHPNHIKFLGSTDNIGVPCMRTASRQKKKMMDNAYFWMCFVCGFIVEETFHKMISSK